MRDHGRSFPRRAAAPLALLFACGCSLPGNIGLSSEPAPHGGVIATHGGAAAAAARPTGPVTGPGPAPILPLNLVPPESPQDQISLLSQKLAGFDDDRKLLAARLAQVEATLQDREKALGEVSDEIRATSEEVTRTRAEIRRVKQENADLRAKLNETEKENIRLLERINKMLEKEVPPGGPPMEPEPAKGP